MKLGFIGLGRMGKNMVLNLLDKRHNVVTWDRSPKKVKEIEKLGAEGAYTIKELFEKLPKQKIIWMMISAGKPVDLVISKLIPYLKKKDIIIDGGNSYYKDSVRRYKMLRKKGINFLDVGTSGGVYGARHGACMMVGGDKKIFRKVERLFKDMCVKDGYAYVGKTGAGHFVKMVHNGIEYGMIGSIAEGFEAIKKSRFKIDLKKVAKVYAHGSIIEGRLMSLMVEGINKKDFKSIKGEVPYGETEGEMKKLEKLSEMKILHEAIVMRLKTRGKKSFKGKIIAMLRREFGGHSVNKK